MDIDIFYFEVLTGSEYLKAWLGYVSFGSGVLFGYMKKECIYTFSCNQSYIDSY